jgi:hypothetical protein
MTGDIYLQIREPDRKNQDYPSCRLQKGLLFYEKQGSVRGGRWIWCSNSEILGKNHIPWKRDIELKVYAEETQVMSITILTWRER